MVYKFADGYPTRGMDSQAVGAELDTLDARHGGLTPEIVVKAAKPKRSPLHDAFEWDDAAAATKYRLRQAGNLIRSVVVESEDHPIVRRFVNVIRADDEGETLRRYMTLDAALADKEARLQVLANAKADLVAFRCKYANLQEVAEVIEIIDRLGL